MKVESQQLKAFLLDAGLLNEQQFNECLEKSNELNCKIDDILVSESYITQEELIKLKAYILGIPFVNLEKEVILHDVLKMIPEAIAKANNIIAFRKNAVSLEVAMLDPEDLRIIEFIKKTTNLRILPRLTTPESIKNGILQYQKTLQAEFGDFIKNEGAERTGLSVSKDGEIKNSRGGKGFTMIKDDERGGEKVEKEELKKVAEEMPVIRVVDTLIKHAILQRASDIHIEPAEKEVLIRYRIDGILRDAMTLPKTAASGIVARIKVLSNLKLDEHRLPQDGRFKVESEEWRYSLRVSTLPVFNGEKIVMRLLPETSRAIDLKKLGFRGSQLDLIEDNLRKTMGLILITGPTGSGKTTTLYSMMDILNEPGVNISTVEDPIEYQMPRINQTQVNVKIGLTFASGLRTLLRQDPDIIMVGEIRDNETASLAINAALTGHLVLSTLHTNSAGGAIPRLIDMKTEPFLISSTVDLIVAQRLMRCLDEQKEEYRLKESDIKNLARYCDLKRTMKILKDEKIVGAKATWRTIPFFRPVPTKDCPDGYMNRIGIHETLRVSSAIRDLIVNNSTADHIQEQARKEGMITMFEDGFIKAVQGITSIEEVLRVIIE
jgi:type IV pilus assembly protein PilB